MNSRLFLGLVVLGSVLLASCYPYEPRGRRMQGPPPPPPQEQTVTSPSQQRVQQQRDQARERDRTTSQRTERETPARDTEESARATPPKPAEDKAPVVATPVPGKEGLVFSPFNNKVIDVKGIPSGTLVRDPTYPASENKTFRVP